MNALLTADRLEHLVAEAAEAVAGGYRAVKLKIGARPLAEDRDRVQAVRRAIGPDVLLRLDANGGWDRDEAVEALRSFAIARPDYVEQPINASDIPGLVEVERRSGVSVAADEAAGSPETARACLEAGVSVLVLKPNVLGGLGATWAIAQEAQSRGTRVVLTSALDRGLVTAGALHLAAALGMQTPCGLATSDAFAEPAIGGLAVHQGAIAVPTGAGLGVVPLADDLKQLILEVRDVAMADA